MFAPRLSLGKAFFLSVLYAAIFAGTYFALKDGAAVAAPSNPNTARIFQDYGFIAGPILSVLLFVFSLALIAVKNLFGMKRFAAGNAVCVFSVAAAFTWFAWFLVFKEPRSTEVARAIIDYLGTPMLYASATAAFVALDFAILGAVLKSAPSEPVSPMA